MSMKRDLSAQFRFIFLLGFVGCIFLVSHADESPHENHALTNSADPATSSPQPTGRTISLGAMTNPTVEALWKRENFHSGESVGLFVGVRQFYGLGDAASMIAEVPFAVDDAIDLASLFVELGLIAPGRVHLALSGEPQKKSSQKRLETLKSEGASLTDARTDTIREEILIVNNQAEARGLLVVSFATHGFTKNGDYLLAQNSQFAWLKESAIHVPSLLDKIAEAKAARKIVLLDACRERISRTRGTGTSEESNVMSASFMNALANARGMVVFSATTLGGVSFDDPALQNGVFTARVIHGLRGEAGIDDRGFITPNTLADYLDHEVRKWIAANQPGYAASSSGITYKAEGMQSGTIPLAYNAESLKRLQEARSREEHLLALLRLRRDNTNITDELINEIATVLNNPGNQDRTAVLVENLERFEREGAGYSPVFSIWWRQVGRFDFYSRPTPTAIATPPLLAPTPQPSPSPVTSARSYIEKILQHKGGHNREFLNAIRLFEGGQYKDAEYSLRRAYQSEPRNADILLLWTEALLHLQDPKGAQAKIVLLNRLRLECTPEQQAEITRLEGITRR